MSAFMLIDLAVLLFVAAAVLALLFSFHRGLSGLLAGVGGAVACGMVIDVAVGLLTGRTASGESAVLYLPQLIRLAPLNAVWLLAIALPGFFISLYNVAWHRHARVKVNGLLVNLLMAAAVCTLVASDLLTLVVMAEIMALCGAFLTGCAQSGKLWFTQGRVGTLLLAAACWLLWQRYGTLEIAGLAARFVEEGPGTAVWLLWLVGFGMLAGVIPLHGWVPQAHAGADAPAAALFSGVVMKVGLFGLVVLPLLAGQAMPLWWGLILLLLGAVTAFVGGLYALMEHNIQRLLAYHTLENIGIILLGLGAGLTGIALGQPALIALGLVGGLYHLINHSLFKTLLLLGAGSVWFTTGHRDIEKLGGIGKRMP
ncbi:MAG TPA: formate hydrogenlyase subunit 3, partial [Enterobacteriaceae bacterium]|nr:formate hydrogenlyase subunit 3 [Enterobacteriaceae bacterium]